jgi:phosphatidylinositol alpha-mannosyltransferase
VRIVLVTEFYYPHAGGITEHVHHLGRSLVRRGHKVVIVTNHVAEAPRSPSRETVDGLEVVRIGIGMPVESNGSQSRVTIGLQLERKMREVVAGADLVHTHSPLFPMLPYLALKAARRFGIPTVGTFHTHFEGSRAMTAFRGLIRKYAGALDCCIAVSESARRSVAPYVKNPFLIIPNGVDVTAWRSGRPRPELAGGENVIFLGRLDPRNDVDVLIQAFAMGAATRPRARLVVVGDGTQRAQCEALVPAALRERVIFAGMQIGLSARADFMASAAVVAFTARICSHPQTLIEAMAAGRPVVAYDIEGVRELVRNGREGYLVPVSDTAELSNALSRVLSAGAAERAAMGESSHGQALPFDWPRLATRIEWVYRSLIAGHPLPADLLPPE